MRKIADLVLHSDARGADSPEFGHLRGSGMAESSSTRAWMRNYCPDWNKLLPL